MVGNQPAGQPHHLNIAPGLALEPPARLDPVQIAVNVKLQENRRVVRRPTGCLRLNSLKAHLSQIKRIDKHVDHANGVALVNEIIQALGQQRPLATIRLFNEPSHQFPRRITGKS